MRVKRQEGFTLIELIIVIVVLGILSGVVVLAVGSTRADAQSVACRTDARTIQTAEDASHALGGSYVPESTLVGTFLRESSEWYDAEPVGASYALTLTPAGTTAGCRPIPPDVIAAAPTTTSTTMARVPVCYSIAVVDPTEPIGSTQTVTISTGLPNNALYLYVWADQVFHYPNSYSVIEQGVTDATGHWTGTYVVPSSGPTNQYHWPAGTEWHVIVWVSLPTRAQVHCYAVFTSS